MEIHVETNPIHFTDTHHIIANGLRMRVRSILPKKAVVNAESHISRVLRRSLLAKVEVTRSRPLLNWPPERFASYLGEWLGELFDGPLGDLEIIIEVKFGSKTGIWSRKGTELH